MKGLAMATTLASRPTMNRPKATATSVHQGLVRRPTVPRAGILSVVGSSRAVLGRTGVPLEGVQVGQDDVVPGRVRPRLR
jgi:hypothetical protein